MRALAAQPIMWRDAGSLRPGRRGPQPALRRAISATTSVSDGQPAPRSFIKSPDLREAMTSPSSITSNWPTAPLSTLTSRPRVFRMAAARLAARGP